MSESASTYRAAPALIVGLDPGEQTGVAAYDPTARRLKYCTSLGFWAMVRWFETELGPIESVDGLAPGPVLLVVIEDARKLPIYGRHRAVRGARRDKLARNVGRIDRDTQLWVEYLTMRGYQVVRSVPAAGDEKWLAETFKQITRWRGRTNQHGRDAARLVWGRSGSRLPPACAGESGNDTLVEVAP